MEKFETTVKRLEAQLDRWSAQLDELSVKAKAAEADAEAEAKARYRQTIADLKAKHFFAKQKLAEVKAAGEDKWGDFKDGMASAWDEIGAAFDSLKR